MRTRAAWSWARAGAAGKLNSCSAPMNAARRTVFMRRSPRDSVKEAREELRRSRLDGKPVAVKKKSMWAQVVTFARQCLRREPAAATISTARAMSPGSRGGLRVAGKRQGKKRGPKGGIKHQPGRGHDIKSGPAQKKRFQQKTAKKRK